MSESVPPKYHIFISHDEAESDLAAMLRADLPTAGLRVVPSSVFSSEALQACAVVVVLMSRYKPPDPVRAAMAAAQVAEKPIVTAWVRGDEVALRRVGREPTYETYADGLVMLAEEVWTALDRPPVELYADRAPDERVSPQAWLARLHPGDPQ